MLMRLLSGVAGGLLVSFFALPALGVLGLKAGLSLEPYLLPLVVLVVTAVVILALRSSSSGRAWRFILLTAAASALILFTVHLLSDDGTGKLSPVVLISFFAGVVMALAGLLLGRNEAP